MELLLNLLWVLLAFPAYWLWRGRTHKSSSWQCLLALGCLLVILFPVVSATDDLRAMRAEMEESPASKRSLRQSSSDKTPLWKAGWQGPAIVSSSVVVVFGGDEGWHQLSKPSLGVPSAPAIERAGRAPPISFLG